MSYGSRGACAVLLINEYPTIGGTVAAGGFGATVAPGRSEPNTLVVLGGMYRDPLYVGCAVVGLVADD